MLALLPVVIWHWFILPGVEYGEVMTVEIHESANPMGRNVDWQNYCTCLIQLEPLRNMYVHKLSE